jgi:glycine/D-amino acid oxidase-like deaminating enzyme
MKKVDIAIIGAGLAGIFAAYELVVQRPDNRDLGEGSSNHSGDHIN